jgi:hypothetical protein
MLAPPALVDSEPLTVVDPDATTIPVAADRASTPVVLPRAPGSDRTMRLDRGDELLTPGPPATVRPPVRRRQSALRLALGLGVTAMVAGAAGGYQLWRAPRVSSSPRRVQARPFPVQIELLPIANPAAAPAARPGPGGQPAPAVLAPAPGAPPAAPVVAPEDAGNGPDGLGVISLPDASSILVEVIGSSKGVQFYRLADPPGVVVSLPNARPRAPNGSYSPGAPFRRVVVGRRGTRSVVRIYFSSEQVPEVTAEKTGVRVTVHPRRPPRRS